MQFGIQLAAILFSLTILYNYFTHKRLPIQSTAFFTCFLVAAFFNLIAEVLSLATINNLESIPSSLNRFTHQLFIGSLDFVIFMLYLYLDLRCHNQNKYQKKQILIRLIPFALSMLIVLFGSLEYNTEASVRYSYGMMAYTVYACVILYITLAIISLIRFRKNFTSKELIAIGLSLSSWSIITLIQFFNPTLLLSSIGIVLMLQFIYMSFENTDKYLTIKDGCVFSKSAFELTINEYLKNKKRFYAIQIVISNYETIVLKLGYNQAYAIINDYAAYLSKRIKGAVFLIHDNTINLILELVEEYDSLLQFKNEVISHKFNDISYKLKTLKKGILASEYETFNDIRTELQNTETFLNCTKDSKIYPISYKDIYYIEVIDNQSFVYTKKDFYEVKEKLYQLEELLFPWNFIRCSKSLICNTQKIVSYTKDTNSRLLVDLKNEETIIVTRQYVKDFKTKINV